MPKVGELVPYWINPKRSAKLYLGDSVEILKALGSNKSNLNTVNLAFADPPFNIGHEYDEYKDTLSPKSYLRWTKECLSAIKPLMNKRGCVWVAMAIKYQAEVKLIMDELGYYWRDTVVWHYSFGPSQRHKLTPSWVALHYYGIHPTIGTWNGDAIRVPSARQVRYSDKRANSSGKIPDNVWCLYPTEEDPVYDPLSNTWRISRVCGTFKERTPHPCQMPESLLTRIITLCSSPGDLVLDPFLGSGTTAACALQLKRNCIGIELSKNYMDTIIIPRLSSL